MYEIFCVYSVWSLRATTTCKITWGKFHLILFLVPFGRPIGMNYLCLKGTKLECNLIDILLKNISPFMCENSSNICFLIKSVPNFLTCTQSEIKTNKHMLEFRTFNGLIYPLK